MSTISTTITTGVTIGSTNYHSPLTITSAGYVVTGPAAGTAIYGTQATLVNDGRITETNPSPGNYGVYLNGVSSVFNAGTITVAALGIEFVSGGYLNNSGTLTAGGGDGVRARDLSTVINSGSVSGTTGLLLQGGGSVSNTGTVLGLAGINVSGAAGTVSNTGLVGGSSGFGVELLAGGRVTNSGVIYGTGIYSALYIKGGAGTIVDSGTILGKGGAAITLDSEGNDLLQLKPGKLLIQGAVTGNGATSKLAFLAGTGTLTGEGADFTGFGQGTVNSGASWSTAGDVTLGAGIKLTIAGTLTVAGTLENAGSINPVSYDGLLLTAGGYLRNDATGIINNVSEHTEFDPAVRGVLGAVTVVNFGVIKDSSGDATVDLSAGGTVVNGSVTDTSALIEGPLGVYGYDGHTTVTNFGSIVGLDDGIGIELVGSGVVTNGAAGSTSAVVYGQEYGVFTVDSPSTVVNFATISSAYYGVRLRYGGTVVDAGLITAGRTAVSFGKSNNNLVVLEDGFTIHGSIVAYGPGSTGNVVELSGSAAAPVTADYNALHLSHFQTAAFAPGNGNYATWTITNDAALPGTIAGFTGIHDTIDLTKLSDARNDATTSFNTLTNVLTVTGDNGSVRLKLDAEDYSGTVWTTSSDGGKGTDVTLLCFCSGTYIATPEGEALVEALRVGDLVLTQAGEVRPVVWIGSGRVLATRGRRNAATPVIVRKGAIAPDVPHRDLHVTKGHSLYLDGVLVPVEFLVNHRTILWDDHAQEVSLYHVELETHDVLVANGVPAESYRDDGNRWLFQNANAGWDQPPHPPCAEVVTGGPIVDALWRRLLDRAGSRSEQVLTDDPDLHLLVDGRRLDACLRTGAAAIFTLPLGARSVRIASRAAAPGELGLVRDPRVLGVALRCIAVRAGSRFRVIDVADDRLVDGFHGYEPDGERRWTDGEAGLPAALFEGFSGKIELVLHVEGTTRYPADRMSERAAA